MPGKRRSFFAVIRSQSEIFIGRAKRKTLASEGREPIGIQKDELQKEQIEKKDVLEK
jgi:hypothetical protein